MRFAALLPFVLLSAVSFAQTSRPEKPFRLELGAYFPNYRGTSFGNDLGVAAGLGYAFARRGDVELAGSLRGAFHLVTAGSGGSSESVDGNLTLTSAFLDARYAPVGCRFFGGVGLGVGRGAIDGDADRTGLLVALEGGYRLSRAVDFTLRYVHAGPDALRGATVSLGFRL